MPTGAPGVSVLYKDRVMVETVVAKLKVYAQPQRLMILSCLLAGERTVSEIDDATRIGQPALSQQLATLRRNVLVRTRRQGTQIFYALADESVALCVRSMEEMLGASSAQHLALKSTAPAAVQ